MMRVKVTREDADGLGLDEWTYDLYGHELRLVHYVREERPSRRHKFRIVKEYSTWANRTAVVVPTPQDVRDEVVAKARAMLRVVPVGEKYNG